MSARALVMLVAGVALLGCASEPKFKPPCYGPLAPINEPVPTSGTSSTETSPADKPIRKAPAP